MTPLDRANLTSNEVHSDADDTIGYPAVDSSLRLEAIAVIAGFCLLWTIGVVTYWIGL